MVPSVTVTYRIDEAVEGADVVMMLRIQLERHGGRLLPDARASTTGTSG